MRILFIPNWNVARLASDDATVQAPDKHVEGEPYWFFTHFTSDVQVDVLDIGLSTTPTTDATVTTW